MSKIFPLILIVIVTAGITYFIYYMLIPVVEFNIEQEDDMALEQRFFGWGSSQTVTIEAEAIEGDLDQNADIQTAEQNLKSCKQGLVDILYPQFHRLTIAIDDESFEDGYCAMAMRTYTTNFESLDCNVPADTLAAWDGWKNRSTPDTTEIRDSCRVVGSFEGIIERE